MLYGVTFDGAMATSSYQTTAIQIVYWEVKPYIYTNEYGQIDGILPAILKKAKQFCADGLSPDYTLKLDSHKQFRELLLSNFSYGHGQLAGVNKADVLWFPLFLNRFGDDKGKNRHLQFEMISDIGISVIVRRDTISLPNRIITGLAACGQIFLLAIILAILFGSTLWLIERRRNNDFPDSFIKGVAAGFHWSIISVTTVGFGDLPLVQPLAQFMALAWLFVGVMFGCVMTATMTDVLMGADIKVNGQLVSVLNESYDEHTAKVQYNARVVRTQSYEHALDLVREGKVYAAMINIDVASWYEEEITDDNQKVPLRIAKVLPAFIRVDCYMSDLASEELQRMFRCMLPYQKEVYVKPIHSFTKTISPQIIYYGKPLDLLDWNSPVFLLLCAVVAVLVAGITFDLFRKYSTKKPEKNTDKTPNEF